MAAPGGHEPLTGSPSFGAAPQSPRDGFRRRTAAPRHPFRDDIYTLVDEAIAELPEELRVAVVAHYLRGDSHGAIARAMGIPRRTVSHRIARAVTLIGESLGKRGIHMASVALAGFLAADLAPASAVPASLTAALGKLALAQSAHAGGAGTASLWAGALKAATMAMGGLIVEKAVVGLVVVAAVLVGLWVWTAPEHKEAPGSAADEAMLTQPAAALPPRAPAPAPAEELAPPDEVAEPQPEIPYTGVRGQVVDAESGEGVAGATVAAVDAGSGGRETQEAVTDAQGRFEISGLAPGTFLIYKKIGPADYAVSAPEDMAEVALRDGQREEGVPSLLNIRTGRLFTRERKHVWGNIYQDYIRLTVYEAANIVLSQDVPASSSENVRDLS